MSHPKIHIILSSIREGRIGEVVAQWVYQQAKQRADMDVELIDLKDYPLKDYYDAMHPKAIQPGQFQDKIANDWVAKVAEADGYLIVTPEYNHGYPASLKNALDYPYEQWNNKAVGFVSYGGFVGGSRAVEQLRQVAAELQLADVRNSLHIIFASQAFDQQGQPNDPRAAETLTGVFDQLILWSNALKSMREALQA
jgi:NAD(P)H-dependent FMN reductase